MKKWLLILALSAIGIYLLLPTVFNLAGVHTARVMLYNGHQGQVAFQLNGAELTLASGQVLVLRSSRFRNTVRYDLDGQRYKMNFGAGQHIVNLGDAPLHVQEVYYYWDETKQEFFPHDSRPNDRLLLDNDVRQGVQTLDNCWDCCLLLPPGERPYKYLVPANKDKRIFVASVM